MIALNEAADRLAEAFGGGQAATLAAASLVEADALGLPRFGIDLIAEWVDDNRPPPADTEVQAASWRDCSACHAPLAVAAATLDVCRAARQIGVAVIFLRGVRGFGRLAPFVRYLADAGLIGLAVAEGPPYVAPHGGTRPVVGTNPLAFAMGKGADRVVIDAASSAATMADIRSALAEGRLLRDGMALDAAGQNTRIAAEVAALLPRDGRTGSLLGLIVELMAGIAGGGRNNAEGRGVFVLAINPAAAREAVDLASGLAGLKRDWLAGGGHWPLGAAPPPDTMLDASFARRLEGHLERLSKGGRR